MHIDLEQGEAGTRQQAGACVIGGGVAGITIARRLLERGMDVVLLESGGLDYERATASLNSGENIGAEYYDLEDARLRFFGGTTAIWGGRVAEFDPIDLAPRPWVPHSGWPIGWEELAGYYPQARRIFELPATKATLNELRQGRVRLPAFDPRRLEVGTWDFDGRFDRFQFRSCRDLVAHPRCRGLTHATATELELGADGSRVESVVVKSLAGRATRITADAFVLAAGGIENPRLLLASRAVARQGVGNDFDQVGRYFMEHPHARGGRVHAAAAWELLRSFGLRHRLGAREVAALIKPAAGLQQQRGILNTALTIVARQPEHASQAWGSRLYSRIHHSIAPTRGGRALWKAVKKSGRFMQQHTGALLPWLQCRLGRCELALLVRAEQAPNPDSRVLLTNRVDALGMPRVALDWRLSQLDIDSVSGLVEVLGDELQRLGLGRVQAASWLRSGRWQTDRLVSSHPIGGYHHMGTTRMSASPRSGVTDAAGQVHGVGNLFVAGSSVFPTSGWANPTLTVVALALRTGDHVAARWARAAAA